MSFYNIRSKIHYKDFTDVKNTLKSKRNVSVSVIKKNPSTFLAFSA